VIIRVPVYIRLVTYDSTIMPQKHQNTKLHKKQNVLAYIPIHSNTSKQKYKLLEQIELLELWNNGTIKPFQPPESPKLLFEGYG